MRHNMTLKNNTSVISSDLYVLKHKDLDVAMVQIDALTGKIGYILDIYLPEELPVGVNGEQRSISEWWASRAVPDSRRGLQQIGRAHV